MSVFDDPEFNNRLFYPRKAVPPAPLGAEDCTVDVGDGVAVHGRLYRMTSARVVILLFHGNGEIASDYDDLADSFGAVGAALAVFGYRGYGHSTGTPTLRNALSDCHAILRHVMSRDLAGAQRPIVLMGRSLGSGPAIELAASGLGILGLVIESGYADAYRVAERRGYERESVSGEDLAVFSNAEKMQRVTVPVLVMHGRDDELIRFEEAEMNHEAAASQWKRLVILDGHGHNDMVCSARYFPTISGFLDELLRSM